ncbi:hypothetical protein [Brachyspira hampsonii]|uniref:Uncharacterized protein n=1 Tax=Brachyspira hampsonii 30446 TaxID=1289135 RepID=A0A2U4EUY7_9SPIR|nr:hypothetical protein [Brachyspira hampsonii]EKV56548.1 hypothetical protein A966_09546 [Brachyspira hampsonii 30446]MBW5389734.1 hypothetical protein [Brachyspira hampsonii]MBW5395046.1 hypothetical protein [Brachyspira hampsonii]OEJ18196.1 hypothetical protein A9495_06225 [Brachyspira hampsonii]PTY40636.1 hypothetical protein DQ06_08740 [Brachyspira hampsonii bv. II]
MNKYILIHKIVNASIFMLFPIAAFYIIEHNNIKTGIYEAIFIIVNTIEILLFILFTIVFFKCEWGTRKQHALVKAGISFIVYLLIIIMTIAAIF